MNESDPVYLRKPVPADKQELLAAFDRSREFHHPWTFPPQDIDVYIFQAFRYLVIHKDTQAIVGSYNISQIVRRWFHSAYLGYEAFVPHQGKGYMSQGLVLLLEESFAKLNLHRLEANIQPGNAASIALVSKAGFKKEGYSPKYLRVGGTEWVDHERWAIVNDNWSDDGSE